MKKIIKWAALAALAAAVAWAVAVGLAIWLDEDYYCEDDDYR